MLTFENYVYRRPDCGAAVRRYGELKAAAEKAATADELCELLRSADALQADLDSDCSLAEIRNTIDTRDPFYNDEVEYLNGAIPAVREAANAFMRAVLASPHCAEAEKRYPQVLFTNARIAVRTSSPDTVELLAQESRLTHEYQKLCASAHIDFMGETVTLAQLGPHKIHPDRAHRRAACCAESSFYMEHEAEFDRIFDDLVRVRTEMAHRLGFESYIELGYLRMGRNCYDQKMVSVFRDEVKKHVVPLVCELKRKQTARIGVDRLKFMDDTMMFPTGNPKPAGSFADTRAAGIELYRKMCPETREFIDFMAGSDLFSLIATEGKAPGGYCTSIPRYKAPFIFSNFNGTAGDVEVFTHEGGHAFADYVASRDPSIPYTLRCPTMESAECHSMSMEFLAWPWLDSFYGDRTGEAKLCHLEDALFFLPYGCLVDEFQHVVYAHPEYTPAERHEAWLALEGQYRPYMDFDGIPFFALGHGWQRQQHIYLYPFYYIDYCLAQTISLEVFALSQRDWNEAWTHYYAFLRHGGTLPFTGLVEAGGFDSPFEKGTLESVCRTVRDYDEAHDRL